MGTFNRTEDWRWKGFAKDCEEFGGTSSGWVSIDNLKFRFWTFFALFYRFKPDWKHVNKVHKLNSPFGDQFYWTVKSIQQTKGSQNWHKNLTTWYEYVERPNEPASVSGNFAGYFSVSPSPIWVILNEQANNGCWSSFWALFTWSHARVFFLSFLYCLSHNL